MPGLHQQVEANRVHAASSAAIGANSRVQAEEVTLGENVRIGSNVEIICDRLELGDGCSIGSGTVLLCPVIECENGCSLGTAVHAELNNHLRLGRRSVIGSRVVLAGRGVTSGEFLWMKNDVVVGGGGSQGPRSYLTIGARSTIIDRCYINLAEEVSIGDNTALSYNVTLLTHGAWQPVLMGFPAKFAPVRIGSHSVVYLNSVVLPGVTIGDYSTVGACSLVVRDVPSGSLAVGNPATVVKGSGDYPRRLNRPQIDALLRSILFDYVLTLPPKGVIDNFELTRHYVTVVFAGQRHTVGYLTADQPLQFAGPADITIAYGALPEGSASRCHFNLEDETIVGLLTPLAEDLRDYLRRRAIRLFTAEPFRPLPLANLQRMKARRERR
jgi:acetyltransferase-like isoleucine patch superfamily enzyme